jgi:hypothetical protein
LSDRLRARPGDLPEVFHPYWWDGAELLSSDTSDDTRAGRDSLGVPGRVSERRAVAIVRERRTHAFARRQLEDAGLRTLVTEADRAEMERPRADVAAEAMDPFLLESRVTVSVRGRAFPGQQRAMIEAKCEALRREIADPTLPRERLAGAERMLHELEEGLATTVELRALERRFLPEVPVPQPRDAVGTVLPVCRGARLVYRVNTVDAEKGSEGEAEAMVFHVVALGAREAAVLFTGGVHGFRHITDLDEGNVHHAWFVNREKSRTDSTAPWIGRRLFRDLRDRGTGELVVHRRRDTEPVAIEKVGEDTSFVRIDGRPWEVPVIRARTSRDDDLVILADPENPLVLRLVESGADLVRTIDAIHSPPGMRILPVAAIGAGL